MLVDGYDVFLAFSNHYSSGVLLLGCNLEVDVNLLLEVNMGWLVVADVAMKSFEFLVVAIYVPNYIVERHSFFWWLGLFLTGPE